MTKYFKDTFSDTTNADSAQTRDDRTAATLLVPGDPQHAEPIPTAVRRASVGVVLFRSVSHSVPRTELQRVPEVEVLLVGIVRFERFV